MLFFFFYNLSGFNLKCCSVFFLFPWDNGIEFCFLLLCSIWTALPCLLTLKLCKPQNSKGRPELLLTPDPWALSVGYFWSKRIDHYSNFRRIFFQLSTSFWGEIYIFIRESGILTLTWLFLKTEKQQFGANVEFVKLSSFNLVWELQNINWLSQCYYLAT